MTNRDEATPAQIPPPRRVISRIYIAVPSFSRRPQRPPSKAELASAAAVVGALAAPPLTLAVLGAVGIPGVVANEQPAYLLSTYQLEVAPS